MPKFSRIYTTPKLNKLLERQAAQVLREREWDGAQGRVYYSVPFPASILVQRLRELRSQPKPMESKCDSK